MVSHLGDQRGEFACVDVMRTHAACLRGSSGRTFEILPEEHFICRREQIGQARGRAAIVHLLDLEKRRPLTLNSSPAEAATCPIPGWPGDEILPRCALATRPLLDALRRTRPLATTRMFGTMNT